MNLAAIKDYISLTKPGMVAGNALSVVIGFLFASTGAVAWSSLGWALLGVCSIVAAACVFNNDHDHEIDLHMKRTKNRALAAGRVSQKGARIFGVVLLAGGVAVLFLYTTPLALTAALAGFLVYVFWYTPLKTRSSSALYVGAIAGAMPALAGYVAPASHASIFLAGALAVFAILFVWQLPHFLAIAIYRAQEYRAAGVPVLPLQTGAPLAKWYVLIFIVAFAIDSLLPVYLHLVGSVYLYAVGALDLGWFALAAWSLGTPSMKPVRAVFFYSLAILPALCVILLVARLR